MPILTNPHDKTIERKTIPNPKSINDPISPNPTILNLPKRVEANFPCKAWQNTKTIVAVSGGPDSVALLRTLIANLESAGQPPNQLVVVHVNHGLRGHESEGDAKFVKELAEQFDLKFRLENSNKVSNTDSLDGPSEETLRDFRYDALLSIAAQEGARYIVMGHNYNDQVETILFRIFRGTGISGLSGIPEMRLGNESVTIIRPMLDIPRTDIEQFLQKIDQKYRIDKSNSSSAYTRNFLRNELIPQLTERFGDNVAASVFRLGEHASETTEYMITQAGRLFSSIKLQTPISIELDRRALADEPTVLVRQFLIELWASQGWPLQSMSRQWWTKICSAIQDSGVQPNQVRVLNLPGNIRLERLESPGATGTIITIKAVDKSS